MSAVPVDGSTSTRLGRAVRATTDGPKGEYHAREKHRRTSGSVSHPRGTDGLVKSGIILGVIAGGGSNTVLLAAGFAAAITESISMGAVGYTSTVSERDHYQAERAREAAEIDAMPAAERQEIRDIYATKGFSGELLDGSSTRSPRTATVTLVGDWRKSGLKMVLIGLGAAAIGFLIGRLFNTAGA